MRAGVAAVAGSAHGRPGRMHYPHPGAVSQDSGPGNPRAGQGPGPTTIRAAAGDQGSTGRSVRGPHSFQEPS